MTGVLHRDPAETIGRLEDLLGVEMRGAAPQAPAAISTTPDQRHHEAGVLHPAEPLTEDEPGEQHGHGGVQRAGDRDQREQAVVGGEREERVGHDVEDADREQDREQRGVERQRRPNATPRRRRALPRRRRARRRSSRRGWGRGGSVEAREEDAEAEPASAARPTDARVRGAPLRVGLAGDQEGARRMPAIAPAACERGGRVAPRDPRRDRDRVSRGRRSSRRPTPSRAPSPGRRRRAPSTADRPGADRDRRLASTSESPPNTRGDAQRQDEADGLADQENRRAPRSAGSGGRRGSRRSPRRRWSRARALSRASALAARRPSRLNRAAIRIEPGLLDGDAGPVADRGLDAGVARGDVPVRRVVDPHEIGPRAPRRRP